LVTTPIRVSDTGISKDFLPYVFDRFRQADSTTTRSHGGLGLGLAIATWWNCTGSIYVDSDGKGRSNLTLKLLLFEGVGRALRRREGRKLWSK